MGIASYIIPVLCALILHGGLLLLLIPHWFHQEDPYRKPPQFIQAQMIDYKTLSNQESLQKQFKDEQLKKAEKEKKRVENEQQRKLEETKKALAEQQDIDKQKAAQQKQETEIKQKVAEEQKRQEADVQKLIKAKEQKVIENARKIAAEKEEDKKKEDAKKKLEADKKRKAEESRKEDARKKAVAADKKRKEDDAKRKESERKAAEEKKRLQEDARLKAENIANQKAAAAERADKMRSEISGYIQALIEKNWRYPSNTRNGMSAKVLIRLFPSGEVDSVEILRSSGDAAFDKSTEQAVLRIGRFTRVSEVDPQFFERELRRVIIEFRPEGLRW
ncbi:cell envelope integrity protein TolA [Neptunomonas antarctica]|uniref:Cell division and transport-associated protein TolA n=1 Tax=Neptunomonas antarctica TaxID=619304 RepID=A0A1N7KBC4_9GAMM|nr:cell envelope integrity protein TolA [Neptunomonas antarctica]SIS58810.1 Cell division and transport-associated protein TolA [Neptunomonas antarctica]